ncbi:hypothetical protein EV141_0416 [Microcella putealis]|uniref:Uncharacterized protein n=1 Tax=Microcella putealis TaxID=337005 RepID=A0A4Q7LY98_9MICO|nr:hypothetical protein [Microcella putealis]RZS59198.1 hypothetical protein EV141_0416 [Microcella putealis]TQM24224.1 hypothetical protein BJ957_1695 [Microcella putealis]
MPTPARPAFRLATAAAASALLLTLAACAPEQPAPTEPVAEPSSEPTPSPEPSETTPEPSPEPELVFTMPADCTVILPADRVGTLEAQGLTLLGGPGSLYGDEYFGDQTPEQLIGGMSCVWGQEGVDLSTILFSVAPLNAVSRESTINELVAQGYVPFEREDSSLAFGVLGEEGIGPAIYNLITDDAWFSVLNSLGGQTGFDESVLFTEEMRGVAYGAIE